ncbi:MAG: restriction endonuclease subunit S [Bryobacteraceae bacterium]|jgi:type I restriction enzyme S subunit
MGLKSGYKQTEAGVIPEDWEVKSVHEVAAIKTGPFGTLLKAAEYSRGDGVPLVSVGEIREGFLRITDRTPRVPESVLRRLPQYVLKTGDIVFGRKGGVERSALIRQQQDGWFLGSDGISIRPSKQCHDEYLALQLQSHGVQEWLVRNALGTTMPSLNQEILGKVTVCLPPAIAEQESIAQALGDADALIESLEQLFAKKRHLKQGTMQELLTGKKRLPSFNGDWKTRPLGEVIAHCSSGATPYRGRPEYYRGEIKWITSGELNYNVITDTLEKISTEAAEKTNLKVHPVGTFLFAITGLEAAGTRGACGIVGSPATTNQSCMAIYPTSELSAEYLYHYYVYRGSELALKYCQGTKQQSYTAKLVRILPIDLPPSVEEQTAIAAVLSNMDAEIAAVEARLSKARQIMQGMMHNLLTGRIRLV